MAMTPGLRKVALTTHVTSSVGWIGAVAAFLALAIAGVGSQDPVVESPKETDKQQNRRVELKLQPIVRG